MNSPREILIAWASSGGFAAVHNAGATDAQIVDDLLAWLAEHDLEIVSKSPKYIWGALRAGNRISNG